MGEPARERERFKFSLKTLLAITTLVAVVVYAVKVSIVLFMLVQVLLPTAIGYSLRFGGMWLPDRVRFWVAVVLLLGADTCLMIIASTNYKQEFTDLSQLVILSLASWLPQLILMDWLISRRS